MIVGAPLSCRRLVGREREAAALRERFQEAARNRGSLVIVIGEAGIGKTRFLLETLQQLKAEGATCLRSQFFEHVSTPMGPLVEIFRELYKFCRPRSTSDSASVGFGCAESDGIDGVIFDSRASQFASIAETLLRYAVATPLVIAIEDIHWADPATLECLQYLASRVEGARLLIILTYRRESRRSPAGPRCGVFQAHASGECLANRARTVAEPGDAGARERDRSCRSSALGRRPLPQSSTSPRAIRCLPRSC